LSAQTGSDPAVHQDGSDSSAAAPDAAESLVFTCPSCAESIVLSDAPANGIVECPACGAQFFAATDPDEIEAEARAEADAEAARDRREAELSSLHVRQVSTLRRSMIRARSYFVTGAWGCLVGALELAWMAGLRIRAFAAVRAAGAHIGITDYLMPIAEVACLIAALFGSRYFFRRACQVAIELKATVMKDPQTPPDLSTLGGGIEQWRGLEQMHQQAESGGDEGLTR